MERSTHAGLTISGSILTLIGAFLPWFSEKFSPPGGSAIIDGKRYVAFDNVYNVMGIPAPYTVVRTAVLALLCLALFDTFSLFFSEDSAGKATQHIAQLLHAPFTQGANDPHA